MKRSISLTAYGQDMREAAIELGFLTAEEFDLWVRPQNMTHPLGGKSVSERRGYYGP
jgi:fumarate hydratase class II